MAERPVDSRPYRSAPVLAAAALPHGTHAPLCVRRDMAHKYGLKYFYDIADRSDFKANPDYKGVCHVALAQVCFDWGMASITVAAVLRAASIPVGQPLGRLSLAGRSLSWQRLLRVQACGGEGKGKWQACAALIALAPLCRRATASQARCCLARTAIRATRVLLASLPRASATQTLASSWALAGC